MKYILLFLVGMVLLTISCSDNPTYPQSNENIIRAKGFYVSSESTELETSTRGTVFLSGKNEKLDRVLIVAYVEIDPNDWGGVQFSIPTGWRVSAKTSSYPEGQSQKDPAYYISSWQTASDDIEYNQRIEIGKSTSYIPEGGGIGTVVIDLEPTIKAKRSLEAFSIIVGVGSRDRNGIHSSYPDFEKIEFSDP